MTFSSVYFRFYSANSQGLRALFFVIAFVFLGAYSARLVQAKIIHAKFKSGAIAFPLFSEMG
ncbi:hypothetical protein [Leptolyngbya sp. CCY15150]|uniref:hypothetical protein n=1 Tax=Leptolyngbya sp. CCY15150 TaxID=2767772 RepID=UPI0019513EAF|nr:hypothetical protein [Leptolyngbya sp. CCY15150]